MDKQPEALRLADALDSLMGEETVVGAKTIDDAASELRRLYALNKELLEALKETLQTLDDENAKPGGAIADTIWYSEHETLFDFIEAAIAKAKEQT